MSAPLPLAAAGPPLAATRSGSGRRPLVRWVVRLFRREWRQQILVLALLTLAVGAAVLGSAAAINAASTSEQLYGSGGALIRLDGADATIASERIADARAQFGTIDVVAHSLVAVPGSVERLDVRDQDPDGVFSKPMLDLLDGRYPIAAGEVALTSDAARMLGGTIGDVVPLGRTSATVVGIVENPAKLDDRFALVAPGTLTDADTYSLLVDPEQRAGSAPGIPDGPGFAMESMGSDRAAVATGMIAVSTLAMALVALVASAGFVVVAQRRQRQFGLLAAIGATDRHVRMVTVANGVIVGVLAAIIGLVAGVAGWLVAAPAVESAANHRIGRFDLPWTVVVTILMITLVMATLAAWWPARTTTRIPVMAALAGRPSPPQPVRRSLLAAVLLVAAGMGAVALSNPNSDRGANPPLLIGGLLAVVVGAVFLAPAAIRVAGMTARRMPFAPRLALRDLSRYQSRAAAALAAIAFGVGIATSIVAVAASSKHSAAEGNLSDRELLIRVGETRSMPDSGMDAAEVARLDGVASDVAAALGAGVAPVALDIVFNPHSTVDTSVREPISLGRQVDAHLLEFLGYPYVATADVLALYGIEPTSLDADADLLTSRTEAVTLIDMTVRPDVDGPPPPSQHVDLPTYDQAPNSLITEAAIERNGWATVRAAWIVESDRPLTSDQIDAAREAAATAGLTIETRDTQDGLAGLRAGGTLAGVVLALAIIAMAVGLLRGESARDVRTMTATGATAGTRRALTATTAAALAGLGAVLGVVLAYGVLVAAFRSDLGELVPLPLSNLAVLLIGLPLAATAVGWVLAGKEPTSFSRQSLD